MTDFEQALGEIRSIRRQVADATEFRGYGPLTLSATAGLAAAAGLLQARYVPEPAAHPAEYAALWLATAVVCAALIATQMLHRAGRLHRGLADEMIRAAVLQFLPAGAAGALLPFALLRAGGTVCLLPGLWQVLFSLGVFASARSMPRAMLWVGAWFGVTGFACLLLGGARALHPLAMAGPYCFGMALVAAIHHHQKNRIDDDEV